MVSRFRQDEIMNEDQVVKAATRRRLIAPYRDEPLGRPACAPDNSGSRHRAAPGVIRVNAELRRLALCLVAAAGLALTGCASHDASGVDAPHEHRYTETISSVLLSEDGKRVAAIGANHHYIFEAPDVLVKALHSPVHSQLQATFSTFHVDKRGVVSGDWTLVLADGASAQARQAALAVGLAPGGDGRLATSGRLVGQRFTGWTYRLGREQDKLNKAYDIEISVDASTGDVVADDAATPIRAAADGVQLIYWAPLAPIVLPILFLSRAKDH
jgi:hypothetical protein